MAQKDPSQDKGSTKIAELRLVKYMEADGKVKCIDLSSDNAGGEPTEEELNDLLMYAFGKTLLPYVLNWLEAGRDPGK